MEPLRLLGSTGRIGGSGGGGVVGADRASATNSATVGAGGLGERRKGRPDFTALVNELGGIGFALSGAWVWPGDSFSRT